MQKKNVIQIQMIEEGQFFLQFSSEGIAIIFKLKAKMNRYVQRTILSKFWYNIIIILLLRKIVYHEDFIYYFVIYLTFVIYFRYKR